MTHEGSGLGSSERDLRKICKGAIFGSGIAVHGADAEKAESAVADWAKKNVGEMSDKGAFITGSTFLIDGGATSSYYYGPLNPDNKRV